MQLAPFNPAEGPWQAGVVFFFSLKDVGRCQTAELKFREDQEG